MNKRCVSVVAGVALLCSGAQGYVRLHGECTAAGGELPAHAVRQVTGWSMGQQASSVIRVSVSNAGVAVAAGLWYPWLLLSPPLAPVITSPVVVAAGGTGVWETVDSSVEIAGEQAPSSHYPFDSTVYAWHGTATEAVSGGRAWAHTVELGSEDRVTVAYFASNDYAASHAATHVIIDVVPEGVWGMVALAALWLARVRRKLLLVASAALLCGVALDGTAQNVYLNYQGVIEMDGGAYHGDGCFKFAIRALGSTNNMWANDGTASGVPLVSVRTAISNGAFRIVLGGYEMMPMPQELFRLDEQLRLYVWFARTAHGPFDALTEGEFLYTVPYAANAHAVGGLGAGAIATTQSLVSISNFIVQTVSPLLSVTQATNLFLLRTGDTCSGQLRASNFVADTSIEAGDGDIIIQPQQQIRLDGQAGGAYLRSDAQGNITIYKNGQPVFEIE